MVAVTVDDSFDGTVAKPAKSIDLLEPDVALGKDKGKMPIWSGLCKVGRLRMPGASSVEGDKIGPQIKERHVRKPLLLV
jgi:hypothetical protein